MEQKMNEESIENKLVFYIDARKAFAIKSIPRSVFRNLSHKNNIDARKAFAIKSIPRSVFRNMLHKNKICLFSMSIPVSL